MVGTIFNSQNMINQEYEDNHAADSLEKEHAVAGNKDTASDYYVR